jgi:pilus assembly protein CpaC
MSFPLLLTPPAPRSSTAATACCLAWLCSAALANPAAAAEVPRTTRAPVVSLSASAGKVVQLASAASADDVLQPLIELERGKMIVLKPQYRVSRIAVGDPEIADFVVNGASEIQVVGKRVGTTNLMVWDSRNRIQAVMDVTVGSVKAQLVRELQRVLGSNDITVDVAGEAVVLRGSVPDLAASEAAGAVARAFFTGTEGEPDRNVINLLSVGGSSQVMLEVKIAEMNRSVRKQFGSNFDALFGRSGDPIEISTFVRNLTDPVGPFAGVPGMNMGRLLSAADDVRLVTNLVDSDQLVLNTFLEALEVNQLGKVLAEPTLVARSGELASFLVGGEIPITIPQDDDTVTIQFKRFGVQLEFIPTVLSEDRIHLQVTPEVSQPTNAFGGASVAGLNVPAFRTRRASTGVELADGQSFAIGGLLQESVQSDFDRIPLLGQLPILGALFRSSRFQRDETELVMIVTPRLVQPLGPGAVPLPGDEYIDPSSWDLLRGRIEGAPPTDDINLDSPIRRSFRSPAQSEPAGGLIGDFGHRLRIPRPVGGDS